MRQNAIQGAKRRGEPWRTTRPDPNAARPPDLVKRDFTACRPDGKWFADFTYLRCWEGLVFFGFGVMHERRLIQDHTHEPRHPPVHPDSSGPGPLCPPRHDLEWVSSSRRRRAVEAIAFDLYRPAAMSSKMTAGDASPGSEFAAFAL
jgi:transposase InsO family protein